MNEQADLKRVANISLSQMTPILKVRSEVWLCLSNKNKQSVPHTDVTQGIQTFVSVYKENQPVLPEG